MANNFNIVQRLCEKAKKQPETPALIQVDQTDDVLTYAELEVLSQHYADFFSQQNLTQTDIALLLIDPSPRFYALFLGLVRVGISVMLIDPGVGLAHMRACLKTVKPSVLIGIPKAQILRFYPELRHIKNQKAFSTHYLPFSKKIPTTFINTQTLSQVLFNTPSNHSALITFTSGSTGRPKAIMRTHGFLLNQGDVLAKLLPARDKAVEFCTLPVFVLANLAQGITTILPPKKNKHQEIDLALILKRMAQYNATRLLAAPNFCARLFSEPSAKSHLQTLEQIHTGGGPVPINLLQKIANITPKALITTLYGSTEAEPIALQDYTTPDKQDLDKIATGAGLLAGYPVNTIELRIIKDQTGKVIEPMTEQAFDTLCLKHDSIGEIVVTGSLVQKSYMDSADNTETKFKVGDKIWHRTGDAGYLDTLGRLWLQGRCKAKLELNNTIIYPFALEAAATSYPNIVRAALIQIDEKNILVLEGEKLDNHEENQLKKHFPYIDKLIYLVHIPVDKRHQSKVLYDELKKIILTS